MQEETSPLVHLGNLEEPQKTNTSAAEKATERGQDQDKHKRSKRIQHTRSQEQRPGCFRHFAETISIVSFNCHEWKNNLAGCQKSPTRNSSFLCLSAINTQCAKGERGAAGGSWGLMWGSRDI